MNMVDQLSLTREEFLDQVGGLTTLGQVHERLFGRPGGFNTKSRKRLNEKYGVDITEIVASNAGRKREEARRVRLDAVVACDCCGRRYRNGDRPSNNRSGRHFCSDECARRFSSNFNKAERNRKKSETLREFRRTHRHDIRCAECGKPYPADLWTKEGDGICPGCASKITPDSPNFGLAARPAAKRHRKCLICGAPLGKCRRPEVCRLGTAFENFVRYLGFDRSALGSERAYEEFDRIRDWLHDLYWNRNMSVPDITRLAGYEHGHKNFVKVVRRFIPLRSRAEGQKTKYGELARHPETSIFRTGIHETWDGRLVTYRSSYELDLCESLDAGRIEYFTECMTIDYYDSVAERTRFAVPDFYLPEFNVIIEVKSAFTFDPRNMLDKAKAYVENGFDFVLEYEHKSYPIQDVTKIRIDPAVVKCRRFA